VEVAIDGNISAYEYILEGIGPVAMGYDKQRIDAGILLVNSKRSDKSPFGTTADLIKAWRSKRCIQPSSAGQCVSVSTGEPILFDEEGNAYGSLSVSKDDNPTAEKAAEG
jgi:hypothetical protein